MGSEQLQTMMIRVDRVTMRGSERGALIQTIFFKGFTMVGSANIRDR